MIGTPEQPWINTDAFLDIERLRAIEMDIIKGICLAPHEMISYGVDTLEQKNRPDYDVVIQQIIDLSDEHPHKLAYLDLVQQTQGKPRFMRRALRILTKLCYGTYSGSPVIFLRRPLVYSTKNVASSSRDDADIVALFPSLWAFIRDLPFSDYGRTLIFLGEHDLSTPIHKDPSPGDSHRYEFLWFRTNLKKQFFMYDPHTGQKSYVTSYSAFFNEQSWHGAEATPEMAFSIRVDGVFTEEFRAQLGLSGITNYND